MGGETQKIKWNIWECIIVLTVMLVASFGTGLLLRYFDFGLSYACRYLVIGMAQGIAVLGGLHFYVRTKHGQDMEALGFRKEAAGRALFDGLRGGLALFVMVVAVNAVLQIFLPEPELQPFAELILLARGWEDMIVPLIIGMVLAPVTEELYFRGFLFPALRERFGIIAGFAGNSFLFGLMHLDAWRFFPLALGGLGLTYLYNRTGNILVPIFAHATWNGIMIILLYSVLRWI